jgi:hypothetical protein
MRPRPKILLGVRRRKRASRAWRRAAAAQDETGVYLAFRQADDLAIARVP